jgi:D-psicose/D-tagatose/L-ribulose 3-epimerase
MYLGMLDWMRVEPLQVTAARLARFGYTSIEISGHLDARVSDIRHTLRRYELSCSGVVALMPIDVSIISAQGSRRRQAVEIAKESAEMAAALDATELTIVPGALDQLEPEASPENEWQWAIDGLQEIEKHASRIGVRIAIEALNRSETYFINRTDQALALAEAVGGGCGVCVDTFHQNIEDADPVGAIYACGDRLAACHVADSNRLACGMGHIDWPRVLHALHDVGYKGALSLECLPQLDRTPANPFPHDLETQSSPQVADRAGQPPCLSEAFYSYLVQTTAETLVPLMREMAA